MGQLPQSTTTTIPSDSLNVSIRLNTRKKYLHSIPGTSLAFPPYKYLGRFQLRKEQMFLLFTRGQQESALTSPQPGRPGLLRDSRHPPLALGILPRLARRIASISNGALVFARESLAAKARPQGHTQRRKAAQPASHRQTPGRLGGTQANELSPPGPRASTNDAVLLRVSRGLSLPGACAGANTGRRARRWRSCKASAAASVDDVDADVDVAAAQT
ncbi:hypothetical protein CCMA1212_002706 [Trichoderma ghanense]|uniref:Uncharacterized protein n=1 Tax=Trichoderma ghanense TaxID=65468 RepID=A0ABY2HAN1_9HYPO